MKKVLSFDFGASSGRAMIATYENGKIDMREIHRFSNDPVIVRGRMYWDTLRLFFEIKAGITKAVNDGGFDAISIDTWGVDFGIIDSKGNLIKKALGAEELPINRLGDRYDFPWFKPYSDPQEVQAYMHFVTALCEMAKTQKRITAKEKEVDNEKYAFRRFLLRLGFIGEQFKAERKILLRNLTGSSAFKSGAKEEK